MNRGCIVLLGPLAAIPTALLVVLVAAFFTGCSTPPQRSTGEWAQRPGGSWCREVANDPGGVLAECRSAKP